MSPAGKTKDAPVEDLEPVEFEAPAVGEAVAYVTVDPNTKVHEEHAALITYVTGSGGVVDLAVIARHARQARPFQNVPFLKDNEDLEEGQRHYWRYPQIPAVPDAEPEEAG